MAEARSRTLRARYVIPVDGPPLADGRVVVVGERIAAVTDGASGESSHDLGDCAILPGLVNAHTHLEFSDLTTPLGESGGSLTDWIRRVMQRRRTLVEGKSLEAIVRHTTSVVSAGLSESLRAGVTHLGEIATAGWSPQPYADSLLRSTVFRELIGLGADRIQPLLEAAEGYIAARRLFQPNIFAGISPHAPYTVSPELVARVAQLSAERLFPVAMHLAETNEELELLSSASGPFVELLMELEAWDPGAIPRGIRPLDYLQLLSRADRALVIHGNYLTSEEIDLLAARRGRMSVVYCPRTHAYFGHGRYPLAQMLDRGVNVALGTDSRASNPNLNLLEEMRLVVHRHREASPETALRMGTLYGAQALGIAHDCGTLTPGKRADLAIVALPPAPASTDPYELLLRPESRVVATYVGGEVVAQAAAQ